ncbi:four helix bundle protein [Reichenbachiella sp. MALMAid0571]|uniref:four helix bundle protein n=1 Tax=Reichenbachiella sp. MALMAid0571 TaxID=3143939 RepID=UPI0032DEA67C
MRDFTKYEIWELAIEVAQLIYKSSDFFPDEEKFGLISQIRRASVSISSNIAEGASRSSDKEFNRFLEIAIGSLFEVRSQLFLAKRIQILKENEFDMLDDKLSVLAKKLNSLRNKLNH